MSGQWTQHAPSPTGYAYPGYPQNYPQQQFVPVVHQYQYEPQSIPYQNYASTQAGAYQQSHQYQQPSSYKPPVAQPTPDTCYNCGSPEHWAQDCPEPRREVPAGDLNRASIARPIKKFRPNYIPPVITKYAVPPNVQNNHGPPQGHAAPPYEQPAIAPYRNVHGQPIPIPAHSPTQYQYSQWHEANQRQVHQISQNPYNNNTYPQPQYLYHNSPKNLPYGQQYSSPVSAEGLAQPHGSYSHYGQGPQYHGSPNSTYPIAPPIGTRMSLPTTSSFSEPSNGLAAHSSYGQRILGLSPTGNLGPQSAALPSDEVEEDDMVLLDIPDVPVNADCYGGSSTRLIKHPIPTCAEDFEALEGILDSSESHGDDHINSKYVDSKNLYSFLERSTYEEDNKLEGGDPVFFHNSHESLDVPLEILSESRGRLTSSELKTVLLGGHEDARNPIRRPGSAYSEDHGYRTHPIMSPIEPSSHYKRDTSSRRRSESSVDTDTRPALSAQETEDRLAALGVTGAPKPVRTPARPIPPPSSHGPIVGIPPTPSYENDRRTSNAPENRPNSRSRSPQRDSVAIYGHNRAYPLDHRSPQPVNNGNRTPIYQRADPSTHDRAYAPAHQPDHIKAWASTEHDPFDPEDKDPDELLYPDHPYPDVNYDQYNPPPPPHVPPPARRTTSDQPSDRDGLISPGSNKRRHDSYSIYGPDRVYNYHQSESPVKLKSERSYDRKRSRDQKDDDSDNEQNKERRRQHDDVTPKLKRRQPKVAEAYRYAKHSFPVYRLLTCLFKL
ncbi:hypothetical protein MMC17_006977 [Xylographa soralifera]|nr:hypothetical protein [Xylographa soralifera]